MFGKIEVLKLLMEKDIPHTSEEHESVLNMVESGALARCHSPARAARICFCKTRRVTTISW
jgi:hypothetical protein